MNLHKISLLCLLLLFISSLVEAKIFFNSKRDGTSGIYVMDDDGENVTFLTDEFEPFDAHISPDGKQIVFKRILPWKKLQICVMNTDGTNIRELTKPENRYIGRISFSPDSTSIVYDSFVIINNEYEFSVNIMDIATGKLKEIGDFQVGMCDWSPDGKYIIYAKALEVVSNTIWIMDKNGKRSRPLIPLPVEDGVKIHRWLHRWSPDGKEIVFIQHEYNWEPFGGGFALMYKAHRYMICDRYGKNIRTLNIPEEWVPTDIDWMDDGKSVVFSAQVGIPLNTVKPRDFVFPPTNIYKYRIWTGEITQLTNHLGKDELIDWISDDVLSVEPKNKKKTQWGTIRK